MDFWKAPFKSTIFLRFNDYLDMARINVIYNKNMLKSTSTGNNFLLRKKLFPALVDYSLKMSFSQIQCLFRELSIGAPEQTLSQVRQRLLNSYLDGAAIQKIWKRRFLGNISNSCCWVTWMGIKPTQKIFFEKISKNVAARGVQNFGIKEGAAELPLEQSQKFWPQISALIWWTYAENFKEISQTVFEQSLIY